MDANLTAVISYIEGAELKISDGIFNKGRRPWLDFADLDKVGKFDLPNLHKLFNRDQANKDVLDARDQPDTEAKEIQTAKLSIDILAGLERDHRMRTRSRIRMFVHGGLRASFYGDTAGPLQRNTVDWLGRIMTEQKA
jgi:hypothetical protein